MKTIKTLDRKVLPWGVRQLVASIDKGNSVFDHAVQRTDVWDIEKRSLLIHSAIMNAPIPPMFCAKDANGKYIFMDGKQRAASFKMYLNDEFELVDIPHVEYDDGSELDINGKYFSELPEDIQEAIKMFSLSINVLDDLEDDQISDIFFRLNNGTPLRSIEQLRVKCPSIKKVQELAYCQLLRQAVSEKARARYTDEDIVFKSLIMIMEDEPCLDNKVVKEFVLNLDLDNDTADTLEDLYARLWSIHEHMEIDKSKKKILSRTHLITLVGFLNKHPNDRVEDVAAFLDRFYNGKKGSTISELYNDCCKGGTGHKENVRDRLAELEKEYENE